MLDHIVRPRIAAHAPDFEFFNNTTSAARSSHSSGLAVEDQAEPRDPQKIWLALAVQVHFSFQCHN
jgi:hypothetical protein